MISLLRKQLEDSNAARDRERLKAESLANVAREMQRRLDEETAKASVLQRTISNAISGNSSNGVAGPHQERPSSSPRRRVPPVTADKLGGRRSGSNPSTTQMHHADKVKFPSDDGNEPDSPDKDGSQFVRPKHRRQMPAASSKRVSLGTLPEEGEEEDDEPSHPTQQGEEDDQQEDGHRSWEYVVQGQYDNSFSEQLDFAPKLLSCFPEEAVASAKDKGVAFVCSRGRRADSTVPNQDDFVLARHSLANDGHIALYGVFDGHGPAGHHCAGYVRGFLPESLFGQRSLISGPEEALQLAFAQVQEGLLQQAFDTETSGTTATVALVLHLPNLKPSEDDDTLQSDSWLYIANVGDSRAVLVSRTDDETEITVKRLTRDHRPDDPEEAKRIHQEGGEVRRLRPGSGTSRIFAQGCQWPALALTRSLGAAIAMPCGVKAEPEIASLRLTPGADELLVLGTDGLFEFCNTKEVATRLSTEGVTDEVLKDVCATARRRWARSSYNDTVDDITVIAVSLDQSLGIRRNCDSPDP